MLCLWKPCISKDDVDHFMTCFSLHHKPLNIHLSNLPPPFPPFSNWSLATWHVPQPRGVWFQGRSLRYRVEASVFNFGSRQHFCRPKTSIFNQSWKWTLLPNKRGANLETKPLKVRHMSRLELFFYLGPPNFISKPASSNVCVACTWVHPLCFHEVMSLHYHTPKSPKPKKDRIILETYSYGWILYILQLLRGNGGNLTNDRDRWLTIILSIPIDNRRRGDAMWKDNTCF